MKRTYQVISADGHIETPADAWAKYVPKKYQDRAPRLVKLDEGGEGWVVEGQPLVHIGSNISAGAEVIKLKNGSYYTEDGTPVPGAGGAVQRLKEQDRDGIDAEVLFPPFMVSRLIEGIADRKVYLAMVQAYNTWLAEDYCAVAPDRLIGCGVIPVSGIDDAVSELKRCKKLGLRSVIPLQFPNGAGSPAPEDDQFWAAALEIDMRVCPHVAMGDRTPAPINIARGISGRGPAEQIMARAMGQSTYSISQTLVAGVFDRFPTLKLFYAETEVSWLPSSLAFFDDSYSRFKKTFNVNLKKKPSEYIREHCYFGFVGDIMAMRLREFLPVDNLMWGSDLPHSVSTFPNSRKWLDEIFKDTPGSIRKKVLVDTPVKFFGLNADAALTPTPQQ